MASFSTACSYQSLRATWTSNCSSGCVGAVDSEHGQDCDLLALLPDLGRQCGPIVKLGRDEEQALLVAERQDVGDSEAEKHEASFTPEHAVPPLAGQEELPGELA